MKQPSWGRETGFAAANHGPKIDPDLQVAGCVGGERDARGRQKQHQDGCSWG